VILNKLASNLEVIERQDSLLRIAAMPENERKDFVKKIVKDLRKSQGLKGEDAPPLLLIMHRHLYFFNRKPRKVNGIFIIKNQKQEGWLNLKTDGETDPTLITGVALLPLQAILQQAIKITSNKAATINKAFPAPLPKFLLIACMPIFL
jgi:hypothetical protein